MSNNIEVIEHHLAPVNYEKILSAISQAIKQLSSEQGSPERLIHVKTDLIAFDIDALADKVAVQFAKSNEYPFEIKEGMSYATVHALSLAEKSAFHVQLKDKIQPQLHQQILAHIKAGTGQTSLEHFANQLLTPMEDFANNQTTGLNYPLSKEQSLEKKRLHAHAHKPESTPWLKAHKLTLTVGNIGSFHQQIIDNICNYLSQQENCQDDDIEEVREALGEEIAQPTSNFSQLRTVLIKESVARIYRDAKVRYLRYLFNGIKEWKKDIINKTARNDNEERQYQGLHLLNNLIKRLQGLDAYIRQEEKDYGYYDVSFGGQTYNYRDIFSRADAFDQLPIITEIDGFLGESTDLNHQTKTFTTGIKLKLNGAVNVHGGSGKSVFEYNTSLLDPESTDYTARLAGARSPKRFYEKVVKVALLYCFVFKEMRNNTFRAGAYFEQQLLPILRDGKDIEKIQVLQQLKNEITTPEVSGNIEILKSLLTAFLTQSSIGPKRFEDPLVLSLDKSILIKDVNKMVMNNIFFQDTFDGYNGKKALKYVSVKEDSTSTEALCKLPLRLTFEPIYYYPTADAAETFTITHETKNIQVLPVFFVPMGGKLAQKYKDVYRDVKRVFLYYRHRPHVHSDPAQAFVYRFTYTLLAYLFLDILAGSVSKIQAREIFCPLLTIHSEEQLPDEGNEQYTDETFIHSLMKVLSHMLSVDYTSGSQGFYLDTARGEHAFKLKNALHSLYSALPIIFRRTQQISHYNPASMLQKLAIIIVSSRKCDENIHSPQYYEGTILGKVIGIERQPDGSMRLQTLSTFSANQNNEDMFQRPHVLLEQVKQCHALGYKHFLYVARAPYTSTLHISDTGKEDLFFMNKDVVQSMRSIDNDIKVYPIFYDKYYVINRKNALQSPGKPNLKADSLYIDDIGELTSVAKDPSKQSLIFFNLFSGIKVNPTAIYNGVISYATLINMYDDPSYDQYIWADLLSEPLPNSLKVDILDFLTLLHFARYEKSSQLGFKLDPYMDIIGDSSVSKDAIFPAMKGNVHFNSLAFLTLVRAVLHTK
ncbi:hypothetical protein [Tengunoibacter tsumagoiensis]|uniref:Uncharacterized protein n=1 Tax=Tengunoibacter tsumagoiensis TaxID=2014871 RepID=A0A402A7R3_9CHLR|nr:hypothetical protein [Tengunoibacter tsumagoiensis]GCE15109.1 hypothetical protein KTT_49680 [Tengunoibacter tsumagoiensis]